MRCPQCPNDVSANARFCEACGAPLTGAAGPAAEGSSAAHASDDESWVMLASGTPLPTPPTAHEPRPEPRPEPASARPPLPIAPPVDDVAVAPPPLGGADAYADNAALAPADDAVDGRRSNRLIWALVVVAGLVIGGALAIWTWEWTRAPGYASVAAAPDEAGADTTVAAGQPAPYVDDFIDGGPTVVLNTTANVAVRALPVDDASAPLRTIAAGSNISGRWVRGRDDGARWLKLADGGYVASGELADPPDDAPGRMAIPFSNSNFGFGQEFDGYVNAARVAQAAKPGSDDYLITAIPRRTWLGMTVVGVTSAADTRSILFSNEADEVQRAMAASGIRFDSDDELMVAAAKPGLREACEVQSLDVVGISAAHSALSCSVSGRLTR